jgi:hypothetical protein
MIQIARLSPVQSLDVTLLPLVKLTVIDIGELFIFQIIRLSPV